MLRFVWDPNKAESNRQRHGVSFELAAAVFVDPFALFQQDRVENGEYRWQAIDVVGDRIVLLVAHTTRDDAHGTEIIRIISARKAQRHERLRYEQEKYRHL